MKDVEGDRLFDILREVADAIDSGKVANVRRVLDDHPGDAPEIRAFIDDYMAFRVTQRLGMPGVHSNSKRGR